MTDSIKRFLAVTGYRRQKQIDYNREHHITPRSVSRAVEESLATYESKREEAGAVLREANVDVDITETIKELEGEMLAAAEELQFEKAALLRDQIKELKRITDGAPPAGDGAVKPANYRKKTRRGAA
jgi:excinuclease ABC subunit B